MTKSIFVAGLLASASVILVTSPSLAQTAPAAPAPQAAPAAPVEADIIVTAQRRSESLSKTPVAVAVISADQLAKSQIVTEQDLRIATPGLLVRASRGSNDLNYAIRGQSVDALSNARPGVLPYVNEVQVSNSGGSSAFYDLQSIQVLKGPQGTLFGRSATGGAVLIATQKPQDDFGGYASASYGNYNAVKVEGALNVPIVKDTVLLRVAGFYQRHDGYQFNLFDDKRYGDLKRYGFRGSLTIKPASGIKNELVVDYAHSDGGALQTVLYNFGPPYNPANPGNAYPGAPIPTTLYYGPRGNPALGQGIGLLPGQTDIVSQLVAQKARGPYVVDVDGPDLYRTRNILVTNTTTVDLGTDTQIKNIFGYVNSKTLNALDADGSNLTIDEDFGNIKGHALTDELQLLGTTLDGKLKYVTGLYYSNEKLVNLLTEFIIPTLGNPEQFNNYQGNNKTYAVYAQGTYDLSSATGITGLGFTAGLRYTDEKVRNLILPGDISFVDPLPVYQYDQSVTSKNVGWTFGLQDQVNSNLLLYAVTRRSYKDAGFNGVIAPRPGLAVNGGNGFGTETVTDAEIGSKFHGYAGTIPFRVNLAAYIDWVKQAQHLAFAISNGNPAALTVNVPAARVQGIELDGVISPASWLDIGGTFNYIDAKFTNAVVGGTVFGPYPDTPKLSGSVFAQVTAPVASGLNVVGRGDLFGQGGTWFISTGNANTGAFIPGYLIANFRLGLESKTGWSVTAVLKNAFNRVYYAGGIAPAQLLQYNLATPGDPRTIAVEARLKF